MSTSYVPLDASSIQAGQWCDHCLSNSIVNYDVVIVSGGGVTKVGSGRICLRCSPAEAEQ